MKTQLGEVEFKIPRDRNGEFEPQIISKYSRSADGIEEKIIGLYACGMSQRDIAEQIKALYDVEISPELVSKISEKLMPEVTAWQNRALEAVYPFVFLDAIHYKVKENHQYVTKAAYVALGINRDRRKDILGVWIGEHESAKFWAGVLNDLKSRGGRRFTCFAWTACPVSGRPSTPCSPRPRSSTASSIRFAPVRAM